MVRTSFGAVASTIAAVRCVSSSDCRSVRARSSSAARTRRPVFGPVRTSAGLVPKNCGLDAIAEPLTTVQFCEMWCPSKRQPHGVVADGVPKIVNR